MAIEGATERAVFFDTDDFGVASSYTPAGGAASTVNGIFDNDFICATADLPGAAAGGDAITISSVAYTVRVIQAEGTGVTTLVLEKN